MGPYLSSDEGDIEIINKGAELVIKILSLPEAARDEVINAIYASYDRTGIAYIDAEIATLLLRFGENTVLGHIPPPSCLDKDKQDASKKGKESVDISFLHHYIPKKVTKSSSVYRSVRIRAERDLSCLGQDGSLGLSYEWRKRLSLKTLLKGLTGNSAQQRVTSLPVKLLAGREMTVPVLIETPKEQGRYTLEIYPIGGKSAKNINIEIEVVEETNELVSRP